MKNIATLCLASLLVACNGGSGGGGSKDSPGRTESFVEAAGKMVDWKCPVELTGKYEGFDHTGDIEAELQLDKVSEKEYYFSKTELASPIYINGNVSRFSIGQEDGQMNEGSFVGYCDEGVLYLDYDINGLDLIEKYEFNDDGSLTRQFQETTGTGEDIQIDIESARLTKIIPSEAELAKADLELFKTDYSEPFSRASLHKKSECPDLELLQGSYLEPEGTRRRERVDIELDEDALTHALIFSNNFINTYQRSIIPGDAKHDSDDVFGGDSRRTFRSEQAYCIAGALYYERLENEVRYGRENPIRTFYRITPHEEGVAVIRSWYDRVGDLEVYTRL